MTKLKTHLRFIYLAFFRYKKGFFYLYRRYVIAPRIIRNPSVLERPITHSNLSMHMLFGERDFLMALWSLGSFYSVSQVIGTLYIHSDGSLTQHHRTILEKLFPSARFIDARDILATHKDFFDTHPTLEVFRREYTKFQSKKLLDPYLSSDADFRLILDSDMLWFKNPQEIEQNLASSAPKAMMMSDGDGDLAYVTFKDGSTLSEEMASFNSGITLYHKDQFDLDAIKEYLDTIDYMHTRFTDQACYATMLKPYLVMLPKDTYIIKGELTDKIVMRHYTSPSRTKFYILGFDTVRQKIFS